ncbi:MAG: preprotein translocase subunit SecG [Spirochaetaceae bacterium]|nr:preprotein translocase subunit SecG [Spirochaetaceae bacterium]
MAILSILLLVIFVIACLLLVLMVLVQNEQGEGIGGIFGGGSSTPFGSRSGNVLTKFTSILAAVFLLTSFGLAWVNKTSDKSDILGAAYKQQNSEKTELIEWWNSTNTTTSNIEIDSKDSVKE